MPVIPEGYSLVSDLLAGFQKAHLFSPCFDRTSFGGHLVLESPSTLPKGYVGCFCFPTPGHHQHRNVGLYDAGQPCMNPALSQESWPIPSFYLQPSEADKKARVFWQEGNATLLWWRLLLTFQNCSATPLQNTHTPTERLPHPLSRPDPLQMHSLGW